MLLCVEAWMRDEGGERKGQRFRGAKGKRGRRRRKWLMVSG